MQRKQLLVLLTVLSLNYVLSDDVGHYVKGREASPGEYPYHVRVETSGRSSCSGAILDDLHVVTAASCLAYKSGSFYNLPVNVTTETKNGTYIVVEAVKAYVSKEYFSLFQTGADLALLKLKAPLDLVGTKLEKLELPDSWTSYEGKNVSVTGYGWNWLKVFRNYTTGKLVRLAGASEKLRFTEVKVVNRKECGAPQHYVCTQANQSSFKDVQGLCTGDVGGPLVHANKTLIGVVTYSPFGCGIESKGFMVYTSVEYFSSFLRKALKEEPDYKTATILLPSSP